MTDPDCPFAELLADPEVVAFQQATAAREAADAAAARSAATAAARVKVRPGSRQAGERRFIGVVRRGRAALVECGHEHTNRNWTTGANGRSAVDCAERIIAGAKNPTTADRYAAAIRTRWTALTSAAGFAHTAATIEAAKTTAAADAAAYLAAVATVRAALVDTATN